MKRSSLLSKCCSRARSRSRPLHVRGCWVACGTVLLSAHTSNALWAHAEQPDTGVSMHAHSSPIQSQLSRARRRESKIWKCLKDILQLARDLARIIKRTIYLGMCFAPAAASTPLLLLDSPVVSQWWWAMLRRGIWAAGPCLTKFAQWAATRPDIFPRHLCDRLAHLQCNTEPHAWSDTERILEQAYGPCWRDVLRLDSEASVGSGLVAQVYRGTLVLGTGSEQKDMTVAVKVLHPDVRQALEDDLAMMSLLVQWVEKAATWSEGILLDAGVDSGQGALASVFSLSESVEEFRNLMTSQLDLQREGGALTRFRKNFSNRRWANRVIFPEPIDVHAMVNGSTSNPNIESGRQISSDVLVETFQQGESMTEVLARKAAAESSNQRVEGMDNICSFPCLSPIEEKQVAALGMDVILKMIFEDNFIHGDLHPGNMLLRRNPEDPEQFQLILLDTGIYSELHREDRLNFLALFKAVIEDDGRGAARMMIEKSREFELPNGQKTKLQPLRQEEFEEKIHAVVHAARTQGLLLGHEGVSGLLRNVLGLCYEHRVKLEPHFVSVVLSVAIIEGLGRRLDPDVDLLARAAPFIAKAAARAAFS